VIDPAARHAADSLPRGLPERVGIDLPRVLKDSTVRDNIILAGGDSIFIPEYDPIVLVQGAVNAPGAVAYVPGKNLDWYVSGAGGYSQSGDKSRSYVTQPNGSREAVKRKTILRDRVPQPLAGAVVFVPTHTPEPAGNTLGYVSAAIQLLATLATLIVVARQ
jgi:protein involved in polysaccharide export with SLBB domain